MKDKHTALYKKLGYTFNDASLLECALSHRSYGAKNNERLEFLGDSILNFIIADALFQQNPDATEGELSRMRSSLVRGETLAELAKEFTLGEDLNLGSGELKSGGQRRKSILADAMEAIIGAAYLDSDMLTCHNLVLSWYDERLANASPSSEHLKDSKTRLQEFLQARKLPLPHYHVQEIRGKDHAQVFMVECQVKGYDYQGVGNGTSRRRAEQVAAQDFLQRLAQQGEVEE